MDAAPDRRTAGFGPSGPHLDVEAVTDPALLETLRVLKPDHYYDLLQVVGSAAAGLDLVAPGQVLARFTLPDAGDATDTASEDGHSGVGQDYDGGTRVLARTAGHGTEFDAESLTVVARAAGIVLYDGEQVGVMPLARDGRVEVAVNADASEAHATLTPPGPESKPVLVADVAQGLASSGVRLGVDQAAIEQAVSELEATGQRVCAKVASGRRPQPGTDGAIEYLVDIGNLPVAADSGDRIDFKNLNIICGVERNQALVRRIPATKGVPGYTVTGRILPAKDGREAQLPLGSNVQVDPGDPNVLRSAIDGNLRVVQGKIEVNKSFTVPGNVDYSTGHIKYDHSVVIRGDVKGGFNVECGGDLEVKGAVEDCGVRAGGGVLIRGGFMGQGAGMIRAGGAVRLGFGRNQTVQCSGPLIVEREAINMTLRSDDSVSVAGLLVGGEVMARNRIECRIAGNPSGSRTRLEVGVVCELVQAAAGLAREIEVMRRRHQPEQEVAVLEQRHKALLEQAYAIGSATIVVKERINPGVLVKIGAAPVIRFAEETRGPVVFTLRDGEVKIS